MNCLYLILISLGKDSLTVKKFYVEKETKATLVLRENFPDGKVINNFKKSRINVVEKTFFDNTFYNVTMFKVFCTEDCFDEKAKELLVACKNVIDEKSKSIELQKDNLNKILEKEQIVL